MTSLAAAAPYAQRRPQAVAPAADPLRRVLGTLREPNTLTAAILVATGVLVIARHPIAHMLGTEVDDTPVPATITAATAPATTPAVHVPSLSAAAVVPTHAPVDPFRALVTSAGTLLAQQPVTAAAKASAAHAPSAARAATPGTTTPTTTPTTPTPTTTATTTACAGTVHRVAAGDTLWGLAAQVTGSNDSGRLTIAWHKLYAVNRTTLGADPSLLRVGESLCLPTKI